MWDQNREDRLGKLWRLEEGLITRFPLTPIQICGGRCVIGSMGWGEGPAIHLMGQNNCTGWRVAITPNGALIARRGPNRPDQSPTISWRGFSRLNMSAKPPYFNPNLLMRWTSLSVPDVRWLSFFFWYSRSIREIILRMIHYHSSGFVPMVSG